MLIQLSEMHGWEGLKGYELGSDVHKITQEKRRLTDRSVCFNGFPSRTFKKFILKQKLTQIFIFTLLCGASKGFMKALKAFIKNFETLQRSVKIKL